MPAPILVTNYNFEQIFIGRNFFEDATYTNSTGSTVTLLPGTVMGRVLATNKVLPNVSTAIDGSELPVGICAETYVVANGETLTGLQLCIKGDVNENAVILGGADTFATAVRTVSTGGGTIRDLIVRNTGIMLVPSIEVSATDNQ